LASNYGEINMAKLEGKVALITGSEEAQMERPPHSTPISLALGY
jgi:hypothetical protein